MTVKTWRRSRLSQRQPRKYSLIKFIWGGLLLVPLLLSFLYFRTTIVLHTRLPTPKARHGDWQEQPLTWSQSTATQAHVHTTAATSGSLLLVPRPFPPWPRERPLPCVSPFLDTEETEPSGRPNWFDKKVQRKPASQGLFFLKLCKTASSTAAGVHLRIVRNLQRRLASQSTKNASVSTQTHHDDWPLCRSRFLHGMAGPKMYRFSHRDTTKSFLWTMLRQPTQRYVSDFFHFEVTRKTKPAHAIPQAFRRYLRHGPHANHHSLNWLAVDGYQYGTSDPTKTAQSILNAYNFIGVAERFEESVVVLSMLLGIPLRDVLYLRSKDTGGYDALCYKIQPSFLSPPMQGFLNSTEWQSYIAPEVELWKAAHASLDWTIETLGRNKVQQNLRVFQKVLRAVSETCTNVTKFPCTAQGEPVPENETDCLVLDMGCGLDCIDAVADAFHME